MDDAVALEEQDLEVKISAPRSFEVLSLGLKPYREVWDLQKTLQRGLIDGSNEEALIICQHPAVITKGRSAKSENVLIPTADLLRRDIEVIEVERGGDVTFHGPGQLVAYPILNLSFRKRDVGWYMRVLEEIIIQCIKSFGVSGQRIAGKTGVWTGPNAKIASIGVRISRWCTMHGLALNIDDSRAGFSLINPCGFTSIESDWLNSSLREKVSITQVEAQFIRIFDALLLQPFL